VGCATEAVTLGFSRAGAYVARLLAPDHLRCAAMRRKSTARERSMGDYTREFDRHEVPSEILTQRP